MLVCLVFHLVWLLWAVISRGFSPDGTTYTRGRLLGTSGTTYQRNALYAGLLNANNLWFRKANPMASSYTKARQEWTSGKRRQDLYNGSDYDWNSFPTMEETSPWPQDYSSGPQQVPTQTSLQPVPQAAQSPQIQVPAVQTPYQVPFQVPTRFVIPFNTPRAWPQARYTGRAFSTTKSQTWRDRAKAGQNARPYPVRPADMEVRNSSRVCSPGPPLGVNPLVRNCLIIGDSISLGYLATVKSDLRGLCQVQHAPFAKGSGAVDSRYGLKCMSMMLRTTALESTTYDAIVFNFGMHDIDYSKSFPEEFVPIEEYRSNLVKIKELLVETGAQVAFALTTPVPIAGRRNRRVVAYNKEAKRVMESGRQVEIVDLHSTVISECGEPPYDTCSIMRQPKDVHFNFKGNKLLGHKVAATLRNLLSKAKPRGNNSPPKAPELSAREGLASSYMHDDNSFCPDMVTRCLAGTTCCENLLSLTGYGCCMEPDAFGCPDSWHCCPRGSHCSPDCNFRSCKCIFPSSRPGVSKVRNEEHKKEGREGKGESKSGSNSEDVKLVKVNKPAKSAKNGKPDKPVEPVKQVIDKKLVLKAGEKNKKVKTEEENGRKDTHKKAATKKKQKAMKKIRGSKKKHFHGLRNKHHLHKKHRKRRSKKGQNSAKKLRGKAKEKASRKIMSKHEVKALRNHHKSNYHLTVKQHWVTRLDKQLRVTKKHKPNFAFSHMWGKRKHHDLSYKRIEKKKKEFEKYKSHTSLTEELKHLIVKHRRKKLRSRLRAHKHGGFKYGIKDNLEQTRRREKSTHSAKTARFTKFHHSKKKKILLSKTGDEVKTSTKHKGNSLSLKGGNLATGIEFNNLRERVQDKDKANEKSFQISHEFNVHKSQDSPVKNHTETWPKDVNITVISSERPVYDWSRTSNNSTFKNNSTTQSDYHELNPDKSQEITDKNATHTWLKNVNLTSVSPNKFERPSNDSTLKTELSTLSTKVEHRTILNDITANRNGKEKINTSTNLLEEALYGFEIHEHDMPSAINNVSNKAVMKTKGLPSAIEIPSSHFKPNRTIHFQINKTDVNQTQNISRPSGKGNNLNRDIMVNSGVRKLDTYVVNTNDSISTPSGFKSKIGEVGSGRGSGSASEFKELFLHTDASFKGDGATEQMDNLSGKIDGDANGSGFQGDEPFASFASGFMDFLGSTPFYQPNRAFHTDKEVKNDMKDRLSAGKDSSGAEIRWKESYFESGNDLIEPKALTDDHQNLNEDNGGESGLEFNGDYSFTSESGFESLSSPSNGHRDESGFYNGRAVVNHTSEYSRADLGLSGSRFDAEEHSGVSKGGQPSNNDSSSDQLIRKLLFENEGNENVTYVSNMDDFDTSKSSGGSVLGGNAYYTSSSWPDEISASGVDLTISGSGIDNDHLEDFQSVPHFGGDTDDPSDVDFFL